MSQTHTAVRGLKGGLCPTVGPANPSEVGVFFRYFFNPDRRSCERPHVDIRCPLLFHNGSPYRAGSGLVFTRDGSRSASRMRRNMAKTFQIQIANVMFKWNTKLGACNEVPNTDTLVHTPTHAPTHTHTDTRNTNSRTCLSAVVVADPVLNGKV